MRDSICQWLFLSWNCLWNYIAHCCLCWWHVCHACIWMLWSDVGLLCAFNQTQSRCWGLGLKWQCADSLQCTGSSCIQRIWQLILAGRQCVSKPTSYQIAFSLDALLSCLCFEKKKKKKKSWRLWWHSMMLWDSFLALYARLVGPLSCRTCAVKETWLVLFSNTTAFSLFSESDGWATNQWSTCVGLTLCVRCSV